MIGNVTVIHAKVRNDELWNTVSTWVVDGALSDEQVKEFLTKEVIRCDTEDDVTTVLPIRWEVVDVCTMPARCWQYVYAVHTPQPRS